MLCWSVWWKRKWKKIKRQIIFLVNLTFLTNINREEKAINELTFQTKFFKLWNISLKKQRRWLSFFQFFFFFLHHARNLNNEFFGNCALSFLTCLHGETGLKSNVIRALLSKELNCTFDTHGQPEFAFLVSKLPPTIEEQRR